MLIVTVLSVTARVIFVPPVNVTVSVNPTVSVVVPSVILNDVETVPQLSAPLPSVFRY